MPAWIFPFVAIVAVCTSAMGGQPDTVLLTVTDSAKQIIKANDSLAEIDSLRKIAWSRQIQRLRPEETLKLSALQSRLDSLSRTDSLRRVRVMTAIDRLRTNLTGYPAILGDDTLLTIHVGLGPFTAQERAQAISNRLKTCANRPGQDSLVAVPTESSVDIMFGETIIMSITERDALWYHVTPDSLSRNYIGKLRSAIAAYRKGHTLWTYIIQGIQIIGILLFSALIVFLVRRLFQSIRRYISVEQEKLIKGIAIKNVSLLTREKQHRLTLQLIGVLQIVVYLAVFYFTLPFLFNVFPWTRSLSNTLVFWIVSPLKKVGTAALLFLPNLFSIAVIVVITQGLIKVAKKLFDEIEKGTLKFHGFYQDWAKPTFNIVRFILYVLMFVMVFPYLPGSDSPIFRGVSVFLGLLFSLGSTSAISNIVAGLVITYMRPFKNGDRIRIGEVVGDVIEKNMLVTRIQTIKNEIITLPNSTILTGHTVNYSINGENLRLILHTTVTIGYDVPWKTVHALLIDAAKRTGGVTQNPEPFVLQKSLNDFYVSYEINAYTESPAKMALIYSELHQNIQDCFTAAKVEIMSPHYLALRDSTGSRAEKPA